LGGAKVGAVLRFPLWSYAITASQALDGDQGSGSFSSFVVFCVSCVTPSFSETKISTKKGPETLWISGQTAVIEGVYILYMPLPESLQEEKNKFVIFFIQFRNFLEYSGDLFAKG
jgi:hypothetical protein